MKFIKPFFIGFGLAQIILVVILFCVYWYSIFQPDLSENAGSIMLTLLWCKYKAFSVPLGIYLGLLSALVSYEG
jgi:hypothetical protein